MEDLSLEQMPLLTIVELKSNQCHWPIGDPSNLDSFRYCGLPHQSDKVPYCSHHMQKSMAAFDKVFACS